MRRRLRAHVAVALACWLSSTQPSAAGQAWSLVESGTTRVISDGSPATAETLLGDLMTTRSMLAQLASIEPQVPLHVFALKDRSSLSGFAPQRLKRSSLHAFGFSHGGPHAAFIAFRTDRRDALTADTLRHEYAHVLTAALSPEAPAWLDEGLSEFWSAVVVDGDHLVVGRPVARHLELLRKRKWLSLDAVMNQRRGSLPSNPGQVELFYAQSWAMVHYLMLGQAAGGWPGFMPQADALPSHFESTLRQYVAGNEFHEAAKPWKPPAPTASSARAISEPRALAERARMLVAGEEPRAALPVAREALALDPNEPLALEVMGTYHFLNNQPDQAREWLARALARGTTSYAAALYMSLLATSPDEKERHLALALREKPDSSVAWQRLAAIFEADGRLEIARRWCRQWSRPPLLTLLTGYTPPCGPGDRR